MAKSDCDDSGTDSPQLWQRQPHMTHIYSIIVADMLRRTIYTIYTAPRKYANCCINLESRWTTHTHKHRPTHIHTYVGTLAHSELLPEETINQLRQKVAQKCSLTIWIIPIKGNTRRWVTDLSCFIHIYVVWRHIAFVQWKLCCDWHIAVETPDGICIIRHDVPSRGQTSITHCGSEVPTYEDMTESATVNCPDILWYCAW